MNLTWGQFATLLQGATPEEKAHFVAAINNRDWDRVRDYIRDRITDNVRNSANVKADAFLSKTEFTRDDILLILEAVA